MKFTMKVITECATVIPKTYFYFGIGTSRTYFVNRVLRPLIKFTKKC